MTESLDLVPGAQVNLGELVVGAAKSRDVQASTLNLQSLEIMSSRTKVIPLLETNLSEIIKYTRHGRLIAKPLKGLQAELIVVHSVSFVTTPEERFGKKAVQFGQKSQFDNTAAASLWPIFTTTPLFKELVADLDALEAKILTTLEITSLPTNTRTRKIPTHRRNGIRVRDQLVTL